MRAIVDPVSPMSSTIESRLPRTCAAIARGFDTGLHDAAQLFVSRSLETIADASFGANVLRDSAMPWLSAGKPITAVAIARLWELSRLDLDDRVAKYIPEFAVGGKEPITIRHLLTHTCGFRAVLGDYENGSWDEVVAAVCNAKLEPGWIIGQTAGYHPTTSWYILGELVRRIDGRAFEDYVREEIFDALEMTHSHFRLPSGHIRPGSSGYGPAHDLGKFYEAFLYKPPAVLRAQTIEAITSPHRVGVLDKSFKHVIDWGLGFITQSNQYGATTVPYSFGPHSSSRAFGHGGSRSSIGFCDPEFELVVVALFNRAKTESEHHARMLEVNAAIYEDLRLVSPSS